MSARQTAKALGTSTPRVLRALAEAGIVVPRGRRARLTAAQIERLRLRLGATPPVAGLSRTEALVAAALARSPLGLVSERAVARRAGVSPTAAGRALRRLREQELVQVREHVLPGRRARRAAVIGADYASPAWQRVAGELARVSAPRAQRTGSRRAVAAAAGVPPYLGHLFWNTAVSQRDTRSAGGYIARRLIQAEDPEGLAWGVENLRAAAWEHAANTRGIAPAARSMALNFARAAR
jgi:ribosomal protein S25